MFPNKPPFFYKCKSCEKIFTSNTKLKLFVKCPHCGSRKIKSSSYIVNK